MTNASCRGFGRPRVPHERLRSKPVFVGIVLRPARATPEPLRLKREPLRQLEVFVLRYGMGTPTGFGVLPGAVILFSAMARERPLLHRLGLMLEACVVLGMRSSDSDEGVAAVFVFGSRVFTSAARLFAHIPVSSLSWCHIRATAWLS